MPPYDKMYSRLFNAITDALELLRSDPAKAREILVRAQRDTEEMYISDDN